MRRSARRVSQIAALSAFAIVAAGCASPSSTTSGGPQATVTSRATAPSASSSPTPTPSAKPQIKSPFAALAGYISSRPGQTTAAVYDERTGLTWVINPSLVEDTASIVKVEIMGTLLHEAEESKTPLSSSVNSLMVTMIEASDNTSATDLLNDAGGPSAVQKFDRSAGMTHTTPSTLAFIPGSTTLPGWGLTTTTAADEVKLVRKFAYPNKLLDGPSREYGLNLMEHIEADQAWGVSGGVPTGTTIALKNGWLPLDLASYSNWQTDSIGWIDGHGRNYVLAVLSKGNASEQDGIDTIDHIAATIYTELAPKPS
jgi:beta-lactamase class A